MKFIMLSGIILALIIAALWLHWFSQEQRRKQLLEKYEDEEVVRLILAKRIWQGMSEEMLVDSWGQPAQVDTKVMKRKENKTYKYSQTGKNRFAKRVSIENGRVVGWQI